MSIASNITSTLNTFGFNAKTVAKDMMNEHKTLQQNFTRLCVEWLKLCATDEYKDRTDGRNIDTYNVAKKINDAIDLDDICLPFI